MVVLYGTVNYHGMMDDAALAFRLAALGQTTRWSMFRRIAEAGVAGLTPGILAQAEAIPPNLVSHHLRPLTAAGLLTSEKVGREIRYRVSPGPVATLAGELLELASAAAR